MYSYNAAGRVIAQKFYDAFAGNFQLTYSWDTEGRMTGEAYPAPPTGPSWNGSGTLTLGLQYDNMGRLGGLTGDIGDGNGPGNYATATYGPAGQLTGLSGNSLLGGLLESRSYNSLLQLTNITEAYHYVNLQYTYSATQNNGRVLAAAGVSYQYDALNRLIGATSGSWGESYQYDGFGGLTAKTPTLGSAPAWSATYNAATNWQTGAYYDANGNPAVGTFDVENRLVSEVDPNSGDTLTWIYDPWGKRVGRADQPSVGSASYLWTLYDVRGQRVASITCPPMQAAPQRARCISRGCFWANFPSGELATR